MRRPQTIPQPATPPPDGAPESAGVNEVRLTGRVATVPQETTLPSGDVVVNLRIVIPRPSPNPGRRQAHEVLRRVTVDTFDVAFWTKTTQRTARRLVGGEIVEVNGALRRRFYRTITGDQSRYEIEATTLRILQRGRPA